MPETVLRIVCMYCGIVMGTEDGKGVEGDSGSICKECWHKKYPDYPYPGEERAVPPLPLSALVEPEGFGEHDFFAEADNEHAMNEMEEETND